MQAVKPSCVGGEHEGIAVWEGAGTDCKLWNLVVWEGSCTCAKHIRDYACMSNKIVHIPYDLFCSVINTDIVSFLVCLHYAIVSLSMEQ